MPFDQIAWLPLCAGVTGVGLVLSFLLLRRRGAAAGLRGAAWSLLPLAAYLTGALPALWQVGTAVVGFFAALVFSPVVWAGVAVAGLSAVLFLVSGVLRRRGASAPAAAPSGSSGSSVTGAPARPGVAAAPPAPAGARPRPQPGKAAQPAKPAADDDFSDIEDILKRRGIG
ncbi:cellulose synthase [Streptosporangium sp. NPDC051022]|uniref:cellulose synthase n=1 Tax=Streptosporangium sp. NPDC051022 TaxID=3155752 RepID=UPI003435F8A7